MNGALSYRKETRRSGLLADLVDTSCHNFQQLWTTDNAAKLTNSLTSVPRRPRMNSKKTARKRLINNYDTPRKW